MERVVRPPNLISMPCASNFLWSAFRSGTLAVAILLSVQIGFGGPASHQATSPADESSAQVGGKYSGEWAYVSGGKVGTGSIYRGLLETDVQVNLTRLFRLPFKAQFFANALLPHGGHLSSDEVGDIQGTSNIEAYNHAEWFATYLELNGDNDRWSFRVGRLTADGDFATTETGSSLHNSSFGWPAFISANTLNTGPAFFRAALGCYGDVELAPGWHFRAGAYDGDSFDSLEGDASLHPSATSMKLGGGQGTFFLTEVNGDFLYRRAPGSDKASPLLHAAFGAWHHTASFAAVADPSFSYSGNHGTYGLIEATVYHSTDGPQERKVTTHVRGGISPKDRNQADWTCDVGLCFSGFVPTLPDDTLAVGFANEHLSRDLRMAARNKGAVILPDFESIAELTYHHKVNEHVSFEPDLQWITHPGGSAEIRNAWVMSLRIILTR